MTKTNVQRIVYYMRKVSKYTEIHPIISAKPRWYKGRHSRLMAYKTEMNRRIEAERGARI
jgi:hypothetical protein